MVSTSTAEYKSPNFLQRWWREPTDEKLLELALAVWVAIFIGFYVMFFVAWDWTIYPVMPMGLLMVFFSGFALGISDADERGLNLTCLATASIVSVTLIVMVIFK